VNILLITSDQQHWDTLGCQNPALSTPNLDRLAAGGTLFNRAYCPNPTCTPTRSSILTGKYPSQHGAWSLGTKLMETEKTLGEYLGKAGYDTGLIGKAHFQPLNSTKEYPSLESYPIMQDLEFWKGFHGPFYGFQHVELARNHADEAHVGQHYALWMEEKGCANWRDYFRPPTGNNATQKHRWLIPEKFHYNAWIAERSRAFMEKSRRADKPFFLWASFFDPHPPYLAPEPWDTMYDPAKISVPALVPGEHDRNPAHFGMTQQAAPDFKPYNQTGHFLHGAHSHLHDKDQLAKDIAVYYGMTSLLDKYVGKILDSLKAMDLEDDTLVVFSTDHGHFFGQHGLIAKGPFMYEDMIRIPFIVRLPGKVKAGKRSASIQSLVDLAPTFLSMAGQPIPPAMTGLDQSPVWTGKRETIRTHALVEHRQDPFSFHLKTYVEERYKITVYWGQTYGELFDLKDDPDELRNLWDEPAARSIKEGMIFRFLQAEMEKESMPMPRIASA
jgi:uncharacterized sulfatase